MAKRKPTIRSKSTKRKTRAWAFTELSLQNVRCFGSERQIVRFADASGAPAQWTIILGNNGSGKSTILECLAEFSDRKFWLANAPGDGSVHQSLPGRRSFVATSGSQQSAIVSAKVVPSSMVTRRSDTLTLTCQYSRYRVTSRDVIPRNELPLFAYGVTRRVGSAMLSEDPLDDPVLTLFDEDARLRNPEGWLLGLDYVAARHPGRARALKAAQELVRNALPGVTNIRVGLVKRSAKKAAMGVSLRTEFGWLPFDALGHGYRTMTGWFLDLTSRMFEIYENSRDPIAEPAVVLVDEIDLHLHPRWQRSLVDYLSERFKRTQFIVTAHSPVFVQSAADARIVVLRRDPKKGHVVIDDQPTAVRDWRIDQLLTSDLFGLPSARPAHLDALLAEHRQLSERPRLTRPEQKRLNVLRAEIEKLPLGESARDAETWQRMEATLARLEARKGRKSRFA